MTLPSERLLSTRTTRSASVQNKAPAAIQITAEQLIREAVQHQTRSFKPPQQRITDQEELDEFRGRKRKEFEDRVRKNSHAMSNWLKYAAWEETQKDFTRARSVYERALEVDSRFTTTWTKYSEMEVRNGNPTRALNVLNRAVTLLPRVPQFWFKFVHIQEMLGDFAGARAVFERWMAWAPDEPAWMAYVKFELRLNEIELARKVYQRFVICHTTVHAWLKYTSFEEKFGGVEYAREAFVKAIDSFSQTSEIADASLYSAFAAFERKHGEIERARAVLAHGIDHVTKTQASLLYDELASLERMFGNRENIETALAKKKRFEYEEEIRNGSIGYDVWFDYIHLEEEFGDIQKVRDIYERAIAETPQAEEKRFWRRYIYLWYKYALFEETVTKDNVRAEEIYETAIQLVPHKKFSFSKLWIYYAKFQLRRKNIDKMRKIFGHGIGICLLKDKLYSAYIAVELSMGEIERCRKLYEGFLAYNPTNCKAWISFCNLEQSLQEYTRVRQISELALNQPLDSPELIWKHYIDFEIQNNEYERAREIYQRLIERTKNIKVWLSFAEFERFVNTQSRSTDFTKMREIFTEGNKYLKSEGLREERAALLEKWLQIEQAIGDSEQTKMVESLQPKKIKKKRFLASEDGSDLFGEWEEYWDYLFPGEGTDAQKHLSLLSAARAWKRQRDESN